MTEAQMRELARRSALAAGLDPVMFEAQLEQESGYNIAARSKAGAMGVAQFMPRTAKGLGINPADPAEAIPAAARYMAQLKKRFGTEELARTAYNWGEGNLSKHLANPRGKAMPSEAQQYNSLIAERAGRAPVTRAAAKLPKADDAKALQMATAEINQGLPPGALTAAAAVPAKPQPAAPGGWLQTLQGLTGGDGAALRAVPAGEPPEDMFSALEDQATREQDNLLAGVFGDVALPDLPGLNAVPGAVDRYLDRLLAG